MAATGGAGRAYLDRLQLAVDVRLIDDVRRWPALAQLSSRIVDRIRESARTRRRVYDELSSEERLLHAVAQALGGQLDDREARTIHDQTSDTDRDVPFVAIVLASRGFDTERARSVYLLALEDRLSPALEDSLRMAFEHGFPPARADRLPARVRDRLLARWPDTTWSRLVRALSGSDHELAHLAIDQPELAASAGPRAIEALAAHGRWRQLLERLDAGTVETRRARLALLAGAAAWRYPLPAPPIGAALATSGAATEPFALALALGTGDSAAALRLARATELQPTDLERACARGLALLGGEVDDVRILGMAMPALGTTTASTVGTIHAALFALELGDRTALRELATALGAVRETPWGRILLARVYLGMGEPSLVEPLLFRDDGPVAAVLRARAFAMQPEQRETAIAWLRDLFLEYPGWSELRLRYGLALASSEPRRGLAILEEAPGDGDADTAVLGPPATARALAQLATAELERRAKRTDSVAMRIRVAMALAPASPAVARQAATLAVAVRDAALAREAHARLQQLAPGARVVERLGAALLELAGDLDRAIATYRSIDAWDRVLVLAARGRGDGADATLPTLDELAASSSVAALHAAAVLASRRGDLELAASALEQAVARRPDHAGLAADFVAVRLQVAQRVLADGDVADLFYAARQLERATRLVDDARLRAARANVVIAMAVQRIRLGELDQAEAHLVELRDELDRKRDAASFTLVGAHLAALMLRDGRPDEAERELRSLPETDHVRLLLAAHAWDIGDSDRNDALVPSLARSPLVAIRAAGRIFELLGNGAMADLAAYAFETPPGEGPAALDVDVAIHVAYELANEGIPHADVASYLERVAGWTTDADGARRARLVALGLRATAPEPERIDIESLDLGQLTFADERELATGLIALEVRRRRQAGDREGAQQALSRLVMLVRPTGAVGVLALASIEDAAEAALHDWRSEPELVETLQAALATQLKVALSRELGGKSHADCLATWQTVVGLLAPVLVSPTVWDDLSSQREDVYDVPHMDLDSARAACQRRIDDMLVALGKWHAARGKDAAEAVARIDEVRHLLATEVSIARTVHTIADYYEVSEAFPQSLGPLGLDLLGRRAQAIEALGEIDAPENEHATAAADLRGILAGALLDGWIALHDGRLDVAEQIARDRIMSQGRAETESIRLLAALYIRRIREAMEETDLNGAAEIATEWVTRERFSELPDELADEIATVCRGVYDRYGLGPARRRLQQIRARAGHDTRTLRDVEAELILRYLDRGRAADAMDMTRLLLEAMTLAPSEPTHARLREQLAVTLAATKEPEPVEELLALLKAPEASKLTDCIVAVQVRKSELADRRLRSSAALEARVEELRRLLDAGRSVGAPLGRLLDRLVFLHERLQQVYETAGNAHEAQRHQRRATAYRNWHAEPESPS